MIYPQVTIGILSFFCASMALRFGLMFLHRVAIAIPNERSSHTDPTPQIGGICIFPVFVIFVAGFEFFLPLTRIDHAAVFSVIGFMIVGFLDDRYGLPVLVRLLLFVFLIGATLFTSGSFAYGTVPNWKALVFIGFFLLSFVNITNFMDGMDWMIIVEFIPVLCLLILLAAFGRVTSVDLSVLAILLGVLAAFVWFNRPPARLFLGDAGSLPLGFLTGYFLICLGIEKNPVSALLPVLYFVFDASITLARRLLGGEKFWTAHRQHAYQQAMDGGQSVASILLRIFLCNIGLCGLSYLAIDAAPPTMLFCSVAGSGLVMLLIFSMRRPKASR